MAIRKLVWVGPLTIVLVVLVNLVVHSFAISFFGVSSSFPYVQAPVIMITTVVFLGLALLIFVLVDRVSNHPVRNFWIVGGIALVVLFPNPLLQLAGHWLPATGMNLPIFWTMIVMHCISALITISLLTTLPSSGRNPNEKEVSIHHDFTYCTDHCWACWAVRPGAWPAQSGSQTSTSPTSIYSSACLSP